MNNLKRRFALAGISSRCYTVEDMEMTEQFKATSKYRDWKKKKEKERKRLAGKVGYNAAYKKVYGKYTPAYMKLKVYDKPGLITR